MKWINIGIKCDQVVLVKAYFYKYTINLWQLQINLHPWGCPAVQEYWVNRFGWVCFLCRIYFKTIYYARYFPYLKYRKEAMIFMNTDNQLQIFYIESTDVQLQKMNSICIEIELLFFLQVSRKRITVSK